MFQTNSRWFGLVLGGALLIAGCGKGQNLGQEEIDSAGSYGIYRSGQPEESEVRNWCKLGIRQVFALNGKADRYATVLKETCPEAQIVYNVDQNADAPTDAAFLQLFDAAVAKARLDGTKILFHCSCGCHRTGRLAAYYRMKFNGWTAEAAIDEMLNTGHNMDDHSTLPAQVRSMEDWINGRACSQEPANCLRTE